MLGSSKAGLVPLATFMTIWVRPSKALRCLAFGTVLFATLAATPVRDDKNLGLPPLVSEDLSARAGELFEAIKEGRPELGTAFFFPREPFLVLKDVHDPGRYHAD